jgi:hypothetical protein
MSDKFVETVVLAFIGSLLTAWVYGAIGNAFGISGTYWGWYWFAVSIAILRYLAD